MQYSAMKTIGVVAKREMAVALKSKMVVGTMLLLILGAIIAPIAICLLYTSPSPRDS